MIFTGEAQNKVDTKGRTSVPAPFRTLITSSPSRELAVFPSFRYKALEGMTFDMLIALTQQDGAAEVNLFKRKANRFAPLLRATHRMHIEETGRITLPANLLAFAGIEQTAVFTGEGNSFLIWSPEAHAEQAAEDMAAAMSGDEEDEGFIVNFAAAAARARGEMV